MDDYLLGQERVTRSLTTALKADRLAHGVLFIGPTGVGRETAARGVASGLLCERRTNADLPFGCGACRACRRARNGQHPDVHIVMSEAEAVARNLQAPEGRAKPSPEIKIDAIRELTRALAQRPYEGRARVAILIDAHKMNEKAQNALLKALEEPAQDAFLLLLVPGERAVLPTIASRCLRLTFNPLAPTALMAVLRRLQVPDAEVRARSGATSVPDALRQGGMSTPLAERLLTVLTELTASDGGTLDRLDVAEALGKDRLEVDGVLAQVERDLGHRLRRRYGPAPVETPLGGDEEALLHAVARAREHLTMNGAVQLVLEELLLSTPGAPA